MISNDLGHGVSLADDRFARLSGCNASQITDDCICYVNEQLADRLNGYYYKTLKNNLVSELYGTFGFTRDSLAENGDSVWHMDIGNYENRNKVIKIHDKENSNE